MTLRKKTLLIISVTILSLMLIVYATAERIILRSFLALEAQDARQQVERVFAALADDLTKLESSTRDWATWDEAYTFVNGENPAFIEKNVTPAVIANLRINLIAFVNTSDQLVYGSGFDFEAQAAQPFPESLQAQLTPASVLLHYPESANGAKGLLLLPEGLALAASCPILNNETSEPSRGALIFGRYLNAAEVKRLADITHLALAAYPFKDPSLPPDFRMARTQLSAAAPVVIQPLNGEFIMGYGLLPDVSGNPAMLFRVELPRRIYQEGQQSVRYFLSALLLACTVLGVIMVGLLEYIVLSRLAVFNQDVSHIRAKRDLAGRVRVTGKDEITHLAQGMNEMLAALEQSQKELRRLEIAVETTEVGITITDSDGRIVYINPADARMHGYAVEELRDQSARIFAPQDGPPNLNNLVEEGQDFFRWKRERLNVRKDGATFPVVLISNPITDLQGQPMGKVVVCEDITERKLAEAKLLEAHRQLKAQNAQLADLNASKDKFFSIISHDLRGPFSVLLGFTQLLTEQFEQYDRDKLKTIIGRLRASAESLYTLLENLLAWALIQRGAMAYSPHPLQLWELAEENLALLSTKAAQKQITLRSAIAPEIKVSADWNMVSTVLRNLLSNALKFTAAGGLVEITAQRRDAAVEVAVVDTGRGMPAEDLGKLFRIDSHYTELGTAGEKGTGLGLSLCKDLVEKNGGRIWVESEVDRGTTFRFTLPVSPG